MTLIEKIDNRFPTFGRKIKNFSTCKKTTVWQDMLLCAAVTLACAFYEFEKFFPALATEVIGITLMILFVVCWLWCSFLNGLRKKYSFLIFIAAFWLIPRLITLLRANMSILDYNKYLDAASQYSRLITDYSMSQLSSLLQTSELAATIALICWCMLLFYIGRLFKGNV
jgi:hypothetical protein